MGAVGAGLGVRARVSRGAAVGECIHRAPARAPGPEACSGAMAAAPRRLQWISVSCILLVEGHGPTREFVAAALSQAGHEVVSAADGQRAWELYVARRPDAVVLGADGELSALALRLRRADPRVLLVLSDREHLGRAVGLPALLPLKANAYVADPTRRELVDKLQQLLSQTVSRRPQGTARVLAREPSSRGAVQPGVVPALLHQVWRSLSEGVLVLEGAGPERRVGFLRGLPVAAQSDDPEESLLRWLLQAGRIDAAAHAAAMAEVAAGLSPGAALVAVGAIEAGEPLRETLAAHVRALVVRAVGAREGRWRFHAGDEFLADGPAVEVAPLPVILEGARLGLPARHLAEALRAVTDACPVRTPELPQLVPGAGLSPADLRMTLSLDGRLTTRAWLEARSAEMKDALSLLWFLALVGAVVFQEAPAGAGDGEPGRGAPRRRRPLPPERADAIRQAALRILPGTHLHALGVELDADGAAVERAYQSVAARFHPDGFALYDLGELADLLDAIQDKLAAAYRVLSDEGRRRAYLGYVLDRLEQAGLRRPGTDVDAEVAFHRAARALGAHRPSDALAPLREAAQRCPREPEYLAALAFALLVGPAGPAAVGEALAQEARKLARKALALAPDHPRAAAALALAEEALGDPAEARRVALAALRAHPGSEVLKRVLFRANRARG
jgi:CheY-like chemotaxis protein